MPFTVLLDNETTNVYYICYGCVTGSNIYAIVGRWRRCECCVLQCILKRYTYSSFKYLWLSSNDQGLLNATGVIVSYLQLIIFWLMMFHIFRIMKRNKITIIFNYEKKWFVLSEQLEFFILCWMKINFIVKAYRTH